MHAIIKQEILHRGPEQRLASTMILINLQQSLNEQQSVLHVACHNDMTCMAKSYATKAMSRRVTNNKNKQEKK